MISLMIDTVKMETHRKLKPWQKRSLTINGKKFYPFKDTLVLDIETRKKDINKGIDAENSETVIWGAYSYNSGKLNFGYGAKINDLIDSHKIIVGHNLKGFDIPILKKDFGTKFWGKTIIDTLETLRKPPSKGEKQAILKKGKRPMSGKGRGAIIGEARIIGMIDNRFPDLKLSTIAKHGYKLFKDHPVYSQYFKEYKDEEFDYDLLQKDSFLDSEMNTIKEYLRQDIVVTKNVFEFMERYFEPLAEFLPQSDLETLQYVHAPTGSYAYKVICHKLGFEEKYGDMVRGTFPGAFVFLPTEEKYTPDDGVGYCRDFTSQHPSHQHGMNLFSMASDCKHKVDGVCPTAHKGDGKIFNLLGTYCACEKGPIEKLISEWLQMKIDYKKSKDPREYTIKILINATYGISSSSIFESIYHKTTGPDTTRMSAQSTKFMANWMEDDGYIITYGDTDSIYIMDPYDDRERMNKRVDTGVAQIKETMPFTDDRYKMGIDAEFSHIFFFKDAKDKAGRYKKKNYIYILQPDNGKVKVKINGLPLLKSTAPKLAKNIYTKYLEPHIQQTKDIKFDKEYLKQLIDFELDKDKNILAQKINVQPSGSYANKSQLQYQISTNYMGGKQGKFVGIKHIRKGFGVGLGVHYCSLEEAKELRLHEFDLTSVWTTLSPFVLEDRQMSMEDFK